MTPCALPKILTSHVVDGDSIMRGVVAQVVNSVIYGVNYQGDRNQALNAGDVWVAKEERVQVGEVVGGEV